MFSDSMYVVKLNFIIASFVFKHNNTLEICTKNLIYKLYIHYNILQ